MFNGNAITKRIIPSWNNVSSIVSSWMINTKFDETFRKWQEDQWTLLDFFQVVYEIDSLEHEIEKRKRTIPQTYKEASTRTETMHEIHRLFDVGSFTSLVHRISAD